VVHRLLAYRCEGLLAEILLVVLKAGFAFFLIVNRPDEQVPR
jgi:hypothetical protein